METPCLAPSWAGSAGDFATVAPGPGNVFFVEGVVVLELRIPFWMSPSKRCLYIAFYSGVPYFWNYSYRVKGGGFKVLGFGFRGRRVQSEEMKGLGLS